MTDANIEQLLWSIERTHGSVTITPDGGAFSVISGDDVLATAETVKAALEAVGGV